MDSEQATIMIDLLSEISKKLETLNDRVENITNHMDRNTENIEYKISVTNDYLESIDESLDDIRNK